jgi:glutaredoxin
MSHQVVLLTRVDCHLCVDALAAMHRVATETGVEWTEVDVDSEPDLAAEYGDRLPVVLLDGAEHGYWSVDEPRLIRDLGAPPNRS